MDRVLAEFADVTEVATATPGVVAWRAREADTGRWVLIKRLPANHGKAMTTHSLGLRHPLIVPARRWLADSGKLYVIRDWVPGRNLRDNLQDRSARAFDRLRNLLDPVLDALEYAHFAGQAHGAISPENILISDDGRAVVSDFGMTAHRNGSRGHYKPPAEFTPNGHPTAKADYYSLCEVYKEFLPERSADDEAGIAARTRILRNLSDVQVTSANAEELRYKLDAVTRIAELLGFCSTTPDSAEHPTRIGPKLVCQVTPPTAVASTGSGSTVVMTIWNEGDEPLRIEAVGSDVVWLNYHTRFIPFTMAPDDERDLVFTLSAARLQPGAYNANLIIRSNHEMPTLGPPQGLPWPQFVVALPVLINGLMPEQPAPPPLAERLPLQPPPPSPLGADLRAVPPPPRTPDATGIACIQEPDPGIVRYGQKGVLHIGVKNIGLQRLRIDKVTTRPSWLSYPGDFQALWIEPGATQYLGFSVTATTLTAGDYRAEVAFVTSVQQETEIGQRNVWQEMKCDVRVRVIRGPATAGGPPAAPSAGCAALIAGILGVGSLLAVALVACVRLFVG